MKLNVRPCHGTDIRYIPEEEPEAEDLKAIRGRDKVASESELLKVLEAPNVHRL
ncbi:MAG: hypothetical protein WC568_03350 [Candidatus Methanoperedens sp.]